MKAKRQSTHGEDVPLAWPFPTYKGVPLPKRRPPPKPKTPDAEPAFL